MSTAKMIVIAAGIASGSLAASAGFFADFDSYSNGQKLSALGGWKGWDNVASAAGVVSSLQSYSGANSIRITRYTDAVHEFSGATSGIWTLTAKQYIGSGQSGSTYFIVMNQYKDGANNNSGMWSTQLRFDLTGGRVYDDFRGGSVAITTNTWATVKANIDLGANTVKYYYNNTLLSQGTWTRSGSSARAIAALDLYSGEANTAYYDDISLIGPGEAASSFIPTPGALAMTSLAGLCVLPRRRR